MTNIAILIGTAATPPNMGQTQTGTPSVRLKLQTRREYKDRTTGEKRFSTQSHTLYAYGQVAERMASDIQVGEMIHINGEMSKREIVNAEPDGNGKKPWEHFVRVTNYQNLTRQGVTPVPSHHPDQVNAPPQQMQAPPQQAHQAHNPAPPQQAHQAHNPAPPQQAHQAHNPAPPQQVHVPQQQTMDPDDIPF